MNQLHELFAASAGAAAAFIGLLFVAISVAPERVFGVEPDGTRRIQAQRAFIALVNVFFVSLIALLPHPGVIWDLLQTKTAVVASRTKVG